MAATNFTPIQLYRTSTASAVPLAANLAAGELAINLADVALFAENASGTVTRIMNNPAGLIYPTADGTAGQVISTNGSGVLSFAAASTGTVTSVALSGGTTGLTVSGSPITTSGTITLAGTLAVANGGTGVTSSTGSVAVVLSTSPTLVTPILGAASATSIANALGAVGTPSYTFTGDLNTGMWSPAADTLAFSTNGAERFRINSTGGITSADVVDAVGYKGLPQNSQSANYTLVLADAGKHIFHPVADNNARTFTIPANGSVAFPVGTAITFINMAVANVTIAITTDTLTLSPAGTSGSRTLATNGSATCVKITSTQWLISGSGLT